MKPAAHLDAMIDRVLCVVLHESDSDVIGAPIHYPIIRETVARVIAEAKRQQIDLPSRKTLERIVAEKIKEGTDTGDTGHA